MNREINSRLAAIIIVAAAAAGSIAIIIFGRMPSVSLKPGGAVNVPGTKSQKATELTTLQRFTSESDFKNYIERGKSISSFSAQSFFGGARSGMGEATGAPTLQATDKFSATALPSGAAPEPQRYSETNVQVAGIDEPDEVKNDGQNIYFSSLRNFGIIRPLTDQSFPGSVVGVPSPMERKNDTKIISAFPPDKLKTESTIARGGQLLLDGKILVVLPGQNVYSGENNKIVGYDVSDPSNPKEKWNLEIKNQNQLVSARLMDGKIYTVTRNFVNESHPCLFDPISVNGKPFSFSCEEIYHPIAPVPTDSVYTVLALDAASGEVKNSTSFIGSASDSTVYMSSDSIFVTYFFTGDFISFAANFLKENEDLVPDWLVGKIEKLKGYDLGSRAKQAELDDALSRFRNSLGSDESMKIDNEFRNRMEEYFKRHKRELEQTGIVKISTQDLKINSSGSVPGKLLNQFSLDEYQDHLRIATTTIGSGWWGFGMGGTRASSNDVYVLDKNLEQTGAIKDLGAGEKIYSARFIGDRGYLVTFRQTDPFFVLDLSDPSNPQQKGELKIPGYSSYLHLISSEVVLGVGEENGQVKLSLFDVSDPANPQEISKYHLDEYFSLISQTHHAFLLDQKHKIFFIPGSQGAYIFSYEGNNLRLAKAVSGLQALRAIYINDFLYVISENKITVLDERTWEKVKELDL